MDAAVMDDYRLLATLLPHVVIVGGFPRHFDNGDGDGDDQAQPAAAAASSVPLGGPFVPGKNGTTALTSAVTNSASSSSSSSSGHQCSSFGLLRERRLEMMMRASASGDGGEHEDEGGASGDRLLSTGGCVCHAFSTYSSVNNMLCLPLLNK